MGKFFSRILKKSLTLRDRLDKMLRLLESNIRKIEEVLDKDD